VNPDRITSGTISSGSITSASISAADVNADRITAGTIASGRINSASISAADVNADRLTSGTIAAARITADSINSGIVSATKITTGTLQGRTIISTSSDTGLRVKITGATNDIDFLSGTSTTGYITGLTGSELLMNGSGSLGLRIDSSNFGVKIGSGRSHNTDIRGTLNIDTVTSSTITSFFLGVDSSGRVRRSTTSFTSDARVKKDIKELPLGVDFLKKLNPISYVLKSDTKGETKYGLIAQEHEEVLESYDIPSSIVNTDLEEKYTSLDSQNSDESYIRRIDYIQLIPILINSISELSDRITVLEKERSENNGN
jgi:hypothetical protein